MPTLVRSKPKTDFSKHLQLLSQITSKQVTHEAETINSKLFATYKVFQVPLNSKLALNQMESQIGTLVV